MTAAKSSHSARYHGSNGQRIGMDVIEQDSALSQHICSKAKKTGAFNLTDLRIVI
jgi:hypothetical protein